MRDKITQTLENLKATIQKYADAKVKQLEYQDKLNELKTNKTLEILENKDYKNQTTRDAVLNEYIINTDEYKALKDIKKEIINLEAKIDILKYEWRTYKLLLEL